MPELHFVVALEVLRPSSELLGVSLARSLLGLVDLPEGIATQDRDALYLALGQLLNTVLPRFCTAWRRKVATRRACPLLQLPLLELRVVVLVHVDAWLEKLFASLVNGEVVHITANYVLARWLDAAAM